MSQLSLKTIHYNSNTYDGVAVDAGCMKKPWNVIINLDNNI